MDINFIGGYQDQKYGLLFVFSHKDKKQWNLFKVRVEDIPFLNNQTPQEASPSEPKPEVKETPVEAAAPQQ